MNRTLNKYHTVAIRCDLPRIEQDYQDESIEIQPPNDFWMKVFQRMNGEIENYQIQYNSTNGPCKISLENFVDRINFVVFQIQQLAFIIRF